MGAELGSGREATVYQLDSKWAAKLFHVESLTTSEGFAKARKVELLQAAAAELSAKLPGVVWPEYLLYNARAKFLGYAMRRVDLAIPLATAMRDSTLGLRERGNIALQIARTVAKLHALGLALGDGSANNILVARSAPSAFAHIVDADSLHLPGFPSNVATPRYLMPKVVRGEVCYASGEEADRHTLAFLIFELLLGGISPYAHRGGGSAEENAAKEFFPYALAHDWDLVPEGPWLERWQSLPSALQGYLRQAFTAERTELPSASSWTALLSTLTLATTWVDQEPTPAVSQPRKPKNILNFWRKAQ